MKAVVRVDLKPGVLDVQGKAVESALHGLGWPGVSEVRVGKVIAFEAPGDDPEEVRRQVEAMCEKLLANPVIEAWKVEIGG